MGVHIGAAAGRSTSRLEFYQGVPAKPLSVRTLPLDIAVSLNLSGL